MLDIGRARYLGQKAPKVSPFWSLMTGLRSAVRLRRRLKGPLRPTWDATTETFAELFHQGSRRIIRLPINAQRHATTALITQLPRSRVVMETRFEPLMANGVPAEWVRRGEVRDAPVLLYLHGGGFGLGSVDTHRDLIARLSWAVPGEVLAINYRLAPEHRFPAQLEDSVHAFRFLLEQGVPAERIVIAGDSAGGGLTLATLVYLRDSGQPLPAAAVCLSPWVDLENTSASLTENERYDYISLRAVNQYARRFVAPEHVKNPLVSPLHADLRGLPPLLVQAGSAEALLDDARRIADCAERAGVDVTLEIYEDMMHVWQLYAFLLPKGREAIEAAGRFAWQHTGGRSSAQSIGDA